MSSIWFIFAVLFLILFLTKKPASKSDGPVDYTSKTYAQGYWNGYRARQKEQQAGVEATEPVIEPPTPETQSVAAAVVQKPVVNLAEQKAKRDLQNINTALYIGSFLLVAAAALFVGTALPESVRFIGVWFVTILFYVAGLSLHQYVPKLRPAAIAFVGTGLAILPFTGIAMYNFVLPNASLCWFITSMIGLIAFVFAAVNLKSQIVAYFAIAFAVSMATSSVATLGAGLIWYFVVLIIFGSILTLIAKIKPGFVPEYFSGPIQHTNSWIVPLTLGSSLFAALSLSLQDYWVICLVSALYYSAVAVSNPVGRKMSIFFTRILLSIAAILMTYDLMKTWDSVGIILSIVGLVQVLISALLAFEHENNDTFNEAWLWIGFSMQVIAPLFVFVNPSWDAIISLQLLVLMVVSFGISYFLRRTELSSFGILSLAVLPIIVCLSLFEPALNSHWLASVFVLFGATTVSCLSLRKLMDRYPSIQQILLVSFTVFVIEALLSTYGASYGWGFGIWLFVSCLIYILVYIERQPWLSLISNSVFLVSTIWMTFVMNVPDKWRLQIISWIIFAVFYGIYLLTTDLSKKRYGVYYWWSAIVVGGLINLSALGVLGYSYYSGTNELVFSAAAGTLVIAAIMILEGWKSRRFIMIDGALVLATIGLQRFIYVSAPNINWLVYTHWWAMIFVGLSYFYNKMGKTMDSKVRSMIALSIISLFTGFAAITAASTPVMTPTPDVYDCTGASYDCISQSQPAPSVPPYKLIFLIEHIFILILGLAFSRKLYSIWGAVGVVLAILWMLSGYTFLVLVFAAAILIGIAIYALVKQSQKGKQ